MGTTEVAEDAPPPPPALAELMLEEAGKARSLSRPPIGASPIGCSLDYSSTSGGTGADTPPLAPSLASPLAGCPMLHDTSAFARAQVAPCSLRPCACTLSLLTQAYATRAECCMPALSLHVGASSCVHVFSCRTLLSHLPQTALHLEYQGFDKIPAT